jgi:hypothetical protein
MMIAIYNIESQSVDFESNLSSLSGENGQMRGKETGEIEFIIGRQTSKLL